MIYRKDEYIEETPDDAEFPVKQIERLESTDGSETRYVGRAALLMQTPFGIEQMPISFEIEADSIEAAFAGFAEHAKPKIEEVKQQIASRLDEMRRAEQSRIVTPDEARQSGLGIARLDGPKRNP